MTFSITGAILGAIVGLVFFAIATSLVAFRNSELIFGLVALLIFCLGAFGRFSVRT